MTRIQFVLLAMLGSASVMLGAYAFQYIGGMAPCQMCIWQRYPHVVAIVIGAVALVLPRAPLILMGALAAVTTAAIGVFHSGVEQGWWEGPTACSAGPISGVSADDLLDQIMSAPLVRCDEIPWEMLGLSMAGWNALLSFGFAALWLMALRRP